MDTADYGPGAIFTQQHLDHTERTVFALPMLTPAGTGRQIGKRLSCVWTLERWRTYLWGWKCTSCTDHQALTALLSTNGTDRAGMCIWGCVPWITDESWIMDHWITQPAASHAYLCLLPPLSLLPELAFLLVQIPQHWPPWAKSCEASAAALLLYKTWTVCEGQLSVTPPPQDTKLYLPPFASHWLLLHMKAIRALGHFEQTKQRLGELYWFPDMDALVYSQIPACSLCQRSDKSAKVFEAPLQPVPLPRVPLSKLPFETATWDCKFAIALTDYNSKWPKVAFVLSVWTLIMDQLLHSPHFSRAEGLLMSTALCTPQLPKVQLRGSIESSKVAPSCSSPKQTTERCNSLFSPGISCYTACHWCIATRCKITEHMSIPDQRWTVHFTWSRALQAAHCSWRVLEEGRSRMGKSRK